MYGWSVGCLFDWMLSCLFAGVKIYFHLKPNPVLLRHRINVKCRANRPANQKQDFSSTPQIARCSIVEKLPDWVISFKLFEFFPFNLKFRLFNKSFLFHIFSLRGCSCYCWLCSVFFLLKQPCVCRLIKSFANRYSITFSAIDVD